MTPEQIRLVQTSFADVVPISDTAAALFYGRLFALDPALRHMFRGDLHDQGRKLMAMLRVVVTGLDRIDTLVPAVRALGRRHATYGVADEHYATVGAALLWTLEQGLGSLFTPSHEAAWAAAYGLLAETMQQASQGDVLREQNESVQSERRPAMTLRLGDTAPDFTAHTTHGTFQFHAWKGASWAILFSHPRDFTPVCTTELGTVAGLKPDFDRRDTKVIGLSVDPLDFHERWQNDIHDVTGNAVNFPMIADPDRTIATLYDMIHPQADTTATVRSVFIVGPDNVIKLMLTYPASTGRNFAEILRALDSLQLTAQHAVATPANWRQGDDVIVLPSVSDEEARARFPRGFEAKKPYLRITPQPNI